MITVLVSHPFSLRHLTCSLPERGLWVAFDTRRSGVRELMSMNLRHTDEMLALLGSIKNLSNSD
jgi:hypothetical protein